MKKKILFIFTLMASVFMMFATTIQPAYAFEGVTNELDAATVTGVNDDNGDLMGIRVTDSTFQDKILLVKIDTPSFVEQNSFHTGYMDSTIYRSYPIGQSPASLFTSFIHYFDDGSVEYSMYWDSTFAYYEFTLYHTNESNEKVSDLPSGLTIETVSDWFVLQSTDNTNQPKYPLTGLSYRFVTFLSSAYNYSDLYTLLADRAIFKNYDGTEIPLSELYVKMPNMENLVVTDDEVAKDIYIEVGFTPDVLMRIYVEVDLEPGDYPQLTYDSFDYLPSSYIDIDGWSVSDYDNNLYELLASLISFDHESETQEALTGFTFTTFDYDIEGNWYETEGTYPVIINQVNQGIVYSWVTFITLNDTNEAPVIDGPTELEYLVEDFSETVLLANFTVTDDTDLAADLTLTIKDTSTLPTVANYEAGTYNVIIITTDTDGAETEYTVSVILVDEITENTVVVTGSIIEALADNWMSIAASTVLMLIVVLFIVKFKGKGKLKNTRKRR